MSLFTRYNLLIPDTASDERIQLAGSINTMYVCIGSSSSVETNHLGVFFFISFFLNFKLIQHFAYNIVSRSSSGCQFVLYNVCLTILEGGSKVKVKVE